MSRNRKSKAVRTRSSSSRRRRAGQGEPAAPESQPGSTASSTVPEVKSSGELAPAPAPEAGIAAPPEAREVQAIVAEAHALAPPPPPVEPGAAGAAPNSRAGLEHDDTAEALIDYAERVAGGDPEALKLLRAEDFQDMLELAFGICADFRGPHWELGTKSAQRLGRWIERMVSRHGWSWLANWAPDIMTALLLVFEVGRRVRIDFKLAEERDWKAAKTGLSLEEWREQRQRDAEAA